MVGLMGGVGGGGLWFNIICYSKNVYSFTSPLIVAYTESLRKSLLVDCLSDVVFYSF